MSTASIANEIIKPVRERRSISVLGLLTNEYFLYVVSFSGFLLIWHLVAASGILGKSLVTPYKVVQELDRMMHITLAGKNLLGHVWASTYRIFIGFSLGAAAGIPLGLFMALNKHVNAVVKPLFDLFKPMPPIAWISISILWFGIEEGSKIFIIFIGAFVPCLLNAYNGIRIIDEELYDVIRMLGGKRRDMIRYVSFPAALPALFAGIQISLSIAWTCVLAAELVSARSGLGWIIIQGMKLTKPELVIGGMIIIAVVAWCFTLLIDGIEKALCPWRRDIKGL